MSVPPEFCDWLTQNSADPSLAEEALALLEQIPKTWESHRRCLPSPPAELAEELLAALVDTTGRIVRRVKFLPFGLGPRAKPTEDDERKLQALIDQVEENAAVYIGVYLDEEPFLDDVLGADLDEMLQQYLDYVYYGHLNVVSDTLYYYLAFVLLGDKESAGLMVSLVKLLPRVIPLGELSDEPDTWVVLVGGPAE